MTLQQLGYGSEFEAAFAKYMAYGNVPGRVMREEREMYLVMTQYGELQAQVAGRLRHAALGRADFPTVGDFVALVCRPAEGSATIHGVLPRKSCISRKIAGAQTDEQLLAANVDTVFLVSGLDGDYNPRRIERYVAAAWESGARPVIILNKADLCDDPESRVAEVESVAPGVAVHAVSAVDGLGMDALRAYLLPGQTIVFLGSSGVGKSTLTNALAGEDVQDTGPLRRGDGHGRHTTTARQLIPIAGGALLIDTPGLRAITLWGEEGDLSDTFDDIEQVIARCRFSDCQHRAEPGCAVREALSQGTLDPGRLENYRKLQRELRHLEGRQSQRARLEERARGKQIRQFSRNREKNRYSHLA